MCYPDTTRYLIGAELEFFTMVMMMFRRVLKIGFVIVKVIYDVDFEHAPNLIVAYYYFYVVVVYNHLLSSILVVISPPPI